MKRFVLALAITGFAFLLIGSVIPFVGSLIVKKITIASWGPIIYRHHIAATIDIHPETLNLKGNGEWITAYIELPQDWSVTDIDVSTIRLNNAVQAELKPTMVGDYDVDGILDLMVKFDRAEVMVLLGVGEAVLTVTGKVNNTSFEGSDTIKVIG